MSELLRLHLKGEPEVKIATEEKTYMKPFSIWETLAKNKLGGERE